VRTQLRNFLLSLPERGLRSASALAGGLLREVGDIAIPKTIRRSQLYRNVVDATLQFLIEQVGQVKGVYPDGEKLSKHFLVRRAAGNGIELIGILTFHASPVWVLAALADASGTGRFLVREITATLKAEGLLDPGAEFNTVDEMLVGLEASAGRLAGTVNTPPLDVKSLRQEWNALRGDLARISPRQLPGTRALRDLWKAIEQEAARQNRTVFQVSSLMAISAMKSVPAKARWLSASARSAARKTGTAVGGILLEDYQASLKQLRQAGYARYAVDHFRPYLLAAVSQFSSRRQSLTERLILMAARRKARRSKSSRTSRRKKKRLISVALLAKESPRVRRPRSLSNLKQLKRPQK
jgi:hypothetical protein